jgi:hypothetical protein
MLLVKGLESQSSNGRQASSAMGLENSQQRLIVHIDMKKLTIQHSQNFQCFVFMSDQHNIGLGRIKQCE